MADAADIEADLAEQVTQPKKIKSEIGDVEQRPIDELLRGLDRVAANEAAANNELFGIRARVARLKRRGSDEE